ncbi:amino acid adenylation domain-containing protein [soil metagenome]
METAQLIYDTTPVEFDPFAGPEISLIAPATESQVEIWTSCLIGGDEANCAYNESASLLLTGVFNKAAMKRALQDMANRHEALRTSFSPDGKNICVYSEVDVPVDYQDLSAQRTDQQKAFIKNYNKQNALQAFDLVNGPLFKAAIFKLNDDQHLLTFVAHHIVCDGWSIGIMMQDLSKFYSAYAKGEAINLPAAPKFSDYARELLTYSQTNTYKETEEYWLDQFIGSEHLLDLPTDNPRPALRTYKSNRQDFILDKDLALEVKKLGKSNGASLVITLLAAFEVFLHRVTGQNEVILGLPAAGQSATDNYGLVGHCVNLLALRSFPKGDLSFKAYLKERRSAVLDAYDNQQYTFGSLLKKLHIARDPSRVPLAPVMFNIDMGLDDDVDFYGLNHKLISNPREYENFEIFLNIAGKEEAPTLEWSYNTKLFKAATIRSMMDDFEFLLRELVRNPNVLIGKIPASNANELKKQLTAWNNTGCAYPKETPLHQLISAQAVKTPDQTAIKFGSKATSYKTLNESANQLASVLIKNNIKPGDKVAFALDRSAEMVVVLLGIMKAGATYIPLDPQFPLNRINFMLADSEASIMLTSKKYKGQYESKAKELLIEDVWETLKDQPVTNPDVHVNGHDLVYILYTSGSTGMPKGVQIAHHNLVNFLYSMQKQPGINSGDKLLAVTTISFDIAGLELFLPLLFGAQIVLADAATSKDGRALLDIIKSEKITIMQATPYTWRIMLEAGWDSTTPVKVICGGEALPVDLANAILTRASSLWNVYGPTETTVWSTLKQIKAEDKVITIGRPIDNTSIYILDKFLNHQPPGSVGEIYIGGEGVAKGYLSRPELTDEKFVNDPFSQIPGEKMYQTGDLGKYMPDGEIMCLGRADAQIKIRGYRIETGEIEFQLSNEGNVKEAVVIARPDNLGIDKLVAFIVLKDGFENENAAAQAQSWRSSLKNMLPDYMVPDNFIVVPAMPLTPNGKIDKKALAHIGDAPTEHIYEYAAPRTDNEKLVAGIWMEYLGLEKVSIHDNFFELGGHSLIAVQVMTRIEKETGKRLPLATLFENSTVEKLSRMLDVDAKSVTWSSLVPIKPQGTKMPLYMVHGAGLNVLLFNTLASCMPDDQPVYGLQAKGLDGIEEPLNKIEDIAAHYIAAIREQNPDGPYALAGYSFGGIIAFEMATQLEAMGKEVKMLAMFDTYAYRSPHYDPMMTKLVKKGRFYVNRIWHTFTFSNGFKNTIQHKSKSVKRILTRYYWKLKYGKNQNQVGFFGYSNKIDEMNLYAEKRYQLKPYKIAVELFRAQTRTFYLDDKEYLGWKPYALNGVNVHNIPGEHNTIFKAPNDKVFAEILQNCLNEAAKK